MRVFLLTFILFPILEIILFLFLISKFGLFFCFLEVFVSFVLGCYLFSKYRKDFSKSFLYRNKFLTITNDEFLKTKSFFLCFMGSIFLILPGGLSDFLGLLLMVKLFQNYFITFILKLFTAFNFIKRPSSNNSDEIIEGEFYDLHSDKRDIFKIKSGD